MEKYRSLIELIKTEYLGGGRPEFDKEVSEAVSKIKSDFQIKVSMYEEEKLRNIKVYEVNSKSDKKCWNFIIGPTSILYATNMEQYRKELIEKDLVKGIFTLKKAFFELSTIPTAVIILGKGQRKKWLTSAITTEDVIALLRDITTYERKVYLTDKLDSKNFMPDYYNGELSDVNETLNKYETKSLKDVADIIMGKDAGRDCQSDTGIPYLRGRNIQNGKIVNVDTFIKMDKAEEYAKQLLEEGDVLLQKQFGYHKIAKVTADDLPAVASSGLFIIRAYGVPSSFLYQYFTSETGKKIFEKQLKNIEKGATIVSIGLKDLKDVRVPMFDEQTISDFCNIEKIKEDELIRIAKKIPYDAKERHPEPMLEMNVYNDFIKAGWKITRNKDFIISNNLHRWKPDFTLFNEDKLLAAVEVKTNVGLINSNWIKRMYDVVKSGEVPFLIITTGSYYEIHSKNDVVVNKMTTPPSKELLLSLLERMEAK